MIADVILEKPQQSSCYCSMLQNITMFGDYYREQKHPMDDGPPPINDSVPHRPNIVPTVMSRPVMLVHLTEDANSGSRARHHFRGHSMLKATMQKNQHLNALE